ncbi:MAG: hypothetical protein K8S54_04135 [Spirochaetia bacterium]|nr:hypothetical protein [Spirochaetia bacterium]
MESEKTKSHRGRKIFLAVILAFVVGYNIVFSAPVFEGIIKGVLVKFLGGQISLKVERSSLFRGFEFKDISIKTADSVFFRADHLTVSYFLPSILIGHIGVRDLSLVRPEIHLKKRNGKWNFQEIFGASASEPEPEKPTDSRPLDRIFTFVWIKLYAKTVIQDAHFTLDIDDAGEKEFMDLDHLSIHLAFVTRTLQEIPLSLDVINIFDTLIVGIAPNQPVSFRYKGSGDVEGKVSLPFFLYREATRGAPEFTSRFHLQTNDLVMRDRGRSLVPQARIYYNMSYDAPTDRLRLHRLLVEASGDPWLDLSGGIDHITSKMPSAQVEVLQSRIELGSIDRILLFLGTNVDLRGSASLYPLKINGPLNRLNLTTKVAGQGLSLKAGGIRHQVSLFRLDLDAVLDIHRFFPLPEKKERDLAFGLFEKLVVSELLVNYNESTLRGDARILPGEGVLANLVLSGFRLTPFSAPAFDGVASGQVHLQSPESFKDLNVKTELHISQARYRMGDSRSNPLELGLVAEGLVGLHEVTTVGLPRLQFSAYNPQGVNVIQLKTAGDMTLAEAQRFDFKLQDLRVNYAELHATLPGSLRYTLAPYRSYLDGGISLNGAVGYTAAAASSLNTDLTVAMPGIHVNDLRIVSGVGLSKERTSLDTVKISALKGALQILVKGVLNNTKTGVVPDLTATLDLASKTLFGIHKNLAIQGGLHMDFKIQKEAVRGNVDAKDLSLEIYTDCDSGSACKKFRVEKMNLTLPVFHDLSLRSPAVLTDSPVGQTFDASAFRGQPNLTLQFIASSHNPRGELLKEGYFYSGTLMPGRDPGVAALLEYRKNVLYFKWLKYSLFRPKARTGNDLWVPDGDITGRDVFFNLADLAPRNMEFGGKLELQNLDLEPYLPASRSNYDGVISASLAFKGRDLGNALYNSDVRLSVYRLSREFSGFATRIIMPNQIAGFIVKSALEIPSITLELQNGLVYSTIGIARKDIRSFSSFLSFAIKPTGEEIRQERIPLAQFLERAKSEAEVGVKVEEPRP